MKENLFKGLKVGRPPLLAGPSLRDSTVSHSVCLKIRSKQPAKSREKKLKKEQGKKERKKKKKLLLPLLPSLPLTTFLCVSVVIEQGSKISKPANQQTEWLADRPAGWTLDRQTNR